MQAWLAVFTSNNGRLAGPAHPGGPPTHEADEAAAFHALVREGQEMRRAFEAKTAKMRILTPDDMKVRSR